VERAGATTYLKKAAEFFESTQQAMQGGRWNAAGLNAVHCAISACDAVLVYYTEQRSAGPDHEAAAYLLSSLAKVPDARQKAETLRRILQEKHVIEYEDRTFTAHEAAELAKLAERFYRWATELLET
jgi:HEPN domain-containing protein